MASDASPHFEPVDDIGFINVSDIDMGERLRPVDPVHVEVLGRAIMREGQATPIVVCRLPGRNDWTLVAGAHRVEAARKFDIEQLKAEIISPDKIGRRQREISENLWRKDLDPIDRANFIAELVRLAKLRAGIDRSGCRVRSGGIGRLLANRPERAGQERNPRHRGFGRRGRSDAPPSGPAPRTRSRIMKELTLRTCGSCGHVFASKYSLKNHDCERGHGYSSREEAIAALRKERRRS